MKNFSLALRLFVSSLKNTVFLAELEVRLLFFTVSVVLLACASFAFGGSCAAWQWYLPLVFASVWFGGGKCHCKLFPNGLLRSSALAFIAIIVVMWLAAPFWLDSYENCDTPAYHLPMVRLLTFGWNPFSDPEAHEICAKLGLDWWGMRPYHVAYCSKPAAIFSAVAYLFVRDPYALTYPLPLLLIAAVFTTAMRVFRRFSITISLLLMILLWHHLPRTLFVDCSLMLASVGLLLTMYADFRDNTLSLLQLAGYGFWMLNLKLPGVMAAGVFFIIYGLTKVWRNRERKTFLRLMALAVVLGFTSFLASFNPYGTSFRDKGHPLYPFKTVDTERFPIRDMVLDFKLVNEDAARMGRLGALVHSYISPRLACAYYNWKLERTDFAPHKLFWDYRWHDDPERRTEPTTQRERVIMWLACVLLLCIPDLRLLGLGLVLVTVCFPFDQIGFLRYQPWIESAFCIAVAVGIAWATLRWQRLLRLASVLIVLVGIVKILPLLNQFLTVFEWRWNELEKMPPKIYTCYEQPKPLLPLFFREEVAKLLDRKKTHSMNLILRNRQLGIEKQHEIVCIGDEEIKPLGLEFSQFGYFAQPMPEWTFAETKFWRLLHRLGNAGLVGAYMERRIERMIGCDVKGAW